jgi:hypothetical protein
MAAETKSFDSVEVMRKTRDKLSRIFKGMTFAEQKREMTKMTRRHSNPETKQKKRTA